MTTQARPIRCPRCGHPTFYSLENPHRPFCSERCRTIDLGHWAAGDYRVAAEAVQDAPDADLEDPSKIPVDG